MTYHFIEGDIFDILPGFEDASFDACFCDPPYHISFMSRTWDKGDVAFRPETWAEVFRVLKPGAPLLAFGGTRTVHRLTCAIEDAGFEIRDTLMWLYGSGFPKSHDISKGIDKALGLEREVIGQKMRPDGKAMIDARPNNFDGSLEGWDRPWKKDRAKVELQASITAPASPESALWSGYGTALKPAWESIILAMKPLDSGLTYAENAMKHGVAGLNVDGARVNVDGERPHIQRTNDKSLDGDVYGSGINGSRSLGTFSTGRWPANLLLSHSEQCVEGTDEIYVCADDCPVRLLDKQSGQTRSPDKPVTQGVNSRGSGYKVAKERIDAGGVGYGDRGGASRFFYQAKVSTRERNMGGINCSHPTLKPISLCKYLATLILPPAHTDGSPRSLLTPFSGAGSEVLGSLRAGWEYVIGVESDPESVAWAECRVAAGLGETVPPMPSAFAKAPRSGQDTSLNPSPRTARQGKGTRIDADALNEGID